MDDQSKHLEWIDKYLGGQLTPAELEEFERTQKEDASFRELVHDIKLLARGIKTSARDSLKQEIREWESKQQDLAGPPTMMFKRRDSRFVWISLAAAACLTAFLYLGVIRPPQSERLANSIYHDYYDGAFRNVIALTYRSEENSILPHREAYAAYDLEDYQKAITLFSEIPQRSDTVLFYLGNSWLALKEYGKAEECFRKAIETGKFMADQLRWYLALSLVKSGKPDEAVAIFRELSVYPNFYQSRALEIVPKLSISRK